MTDVIHLFSPRIFTLKEANDLLPVIRKITKDALGKFLLLEQKLKHTEENSEKWKQTEMEISILLNRWGEKITRLGCHPKGIWLVDFDNGKGFYCWRYDEESIEYRHSYQEGFSSRIPIS